MRRAAARAVLATAVLAVGCALLASAASAATVAASVGFHLKHGRYQVSVANLGGTVVLSVEAGALRSQQHVAASSYLVHGTATESRLEASFGDLGSISMRFHPSPNQTWVKPDRNCRGLGQFLVRHGTWEGRLRFPGEDDYLGLDLHRVRGIVETIAPKCRRTGQAAAAAAARDRAAADLGSLPLIQPSQEPGLGPEVPVLLAHWRHGVSAAEFLGGAGREGSTFFAATEEALGRLAIFRSARAEAGPKAVTADRALTTAKLTPSAPFHGSGRYRAAADGTRTWDGRLFVSFPGDPHYQLTGEPFEPSLELFPELLVGLVGIFSADRSSARLSP